MRCICFFPVVFALLAGRAGAVPADDLDATLSAGERFRGRVAYASDLDRVEFQVLPGALLSLKVKAEAGSLVKPNVELWQDGQPLAYDARRLRTNARGTRWKLNRVPVASGAPIEARVGGGGRLGTYLLEPRELLPERLRGRIAVEAAGSGLVLFPARQGAVAWIVLSTRRRAPEALQAPAILEPSGAALDLEGLIAPAQEGRRLAIGPLALGEDGVYRLLLPAGAQAASIVYRIDLEQPEPSGGDVFEDAGHAVASGSITLEDGYWISSGDSGDFSSDETLVQLAGDADVTAVARELDCDVAAGGGGGWYRLRKCGAAVAGLAASAGARVRTEELTLAARALAVVRRAEKNHVRGHFSVPNDPLYPQQWDLPAAGFSAAWSVEGGDPSRVVAVLDTGIRAEHPDLAGRLTAGYDFVGDSWNAGDGNGYDADPTDPFLGMGTHGTHVTGTLAAATGNGIGMAGGTSAGLVMPVRVLGILGGTDFDIAEGVRYAAGLANASGKLPAVRAEAINMSLGGPNLSLILQQAIRDAVAAGVVVVAAAGNSNSTTPMYPAAFPEVIAVSATDLISRRAYYSSFGAHIDIAAPGGDKRVDKNGDGYPDGILSTVVDVSYGPTYVQKTGTSMAAPHVTAAAFLIRSADPALSPLEVRAYLAAGAQDLGAAGMDPEFGAGLLDAGRSVALAAGSGGGAPLPFTLPGPLAVSAGVEEAQVPVVNAGGGGPIQIHAVSSDRFWVEPVDTTGQTPVSLRLRLLTAGLAAGSYDSKLTVSTSAGPLEVPVKVEVGEGGDVGIQEVFVLAVDVISGVVVDSLRVTAEDADFYQFADLAEGTYRLVAVTDLDYDGVAGEDHDYAGEVDNGSGGKPGVVLVDGDELTSLAISLKKGASAALPGGGNYQL